jgi:hypothetical protein
MSAENQRITLGTDLTEWFGFLTEGSSDSYLCIARRARVPWHNPSG